MIFLSNTVPRIDRNHYNDICDNNGLQLNPVTSKSLYTHYDDAIMGAMASQSQPQPFIRAQNKENIKTPGHWPLCGEFTGDRWIPRSKGQ